MAKSAQQIVPKYRLTERSYINDKLLEVDEEIEFSGIPGPHMEPLNAAAKKEVSKYSREWFDPIRSLEITPPKKEEKISTENPGGVISG